MTSGLRNASIIGGQDVICLTLVAEKDLVELGSYFVLVLLAVSNIVATVDSKIFGVLGGDTDVVVYFAEKSYVILLALVASLFSSVVGNLILVGNKCLQSVAISCTIRGI